MVSRTVIARNGAPFAVLRTAAYWTLFDKEIFNSGAANTCIGSGHSGRMSSGEAAHMNARFLDWETPKVPASRIPNLTCINTNEYSLVPPKYNDQEINKLQLSSIPDIPSQEAKLRLI